MEYILQTKDISKSYKKHKALDGVTMNIKKGDIYGFVGENGSGKTTIIRVITGLIFANSGSYELFGISSTSKNILSVRNKVGAIVESPSIYQNMTAYENLKMQCHILGFNDDNKIKEVLAEVGLSDLYDSSKKAGNFSLGMRQRLGIAMCLLGDVEFLILDEPMNGLDPAGIVEIRELILKLNKERGITFLISSHILTELSLVATKYGIISKGKIIKEITSEELKDECRRCIFIRCDDADFAGKTLSNIVEKRDIKITSHCVKIYGEYELNSILEALLSAKINIKNINCSDANIEDYYMSVVGGGIHA